jgi:hypothetical protein
MAIYGTSGLAKHIFCSLVVVGSFRTKLCPMFGASVSQVAVRQADGHFPVHTTSPYQPGPLSQQSLSILSESRTPRWGLFSWSWYTMLFMLGAASWLWSFAQLGENFIFAIHKPQCLVKTGRYQYV